MVLIKCTTQSNRWIPKNLSDSSRLNQSHNCPKEMAIQMHIQNIQSFQLSLKTTLPFLPIITNKLFKLEKMATVTTQASAAIFRPCASRTRFLTGSSGKLNREVSFRPSTSSSYNSFKVEAKKGQWLPGLASPDYLDGRYVLIFTFAYK